MRPALLVAALQVALAGVPLQAVLAADAAVAAASTAAVQAGPGWLSGQVFDAEEGTPVVDALVSVAATGAEALTDADGFFQLELPAGTHSLTVVADGYDGQTRDGVEVRAGEAASERLDLFAASAATGGTAEQELGEVVVTGAKAQEGAQDTFVEERRSSAAVTDSLAAEQISRAGDSDAAGALKRVTGLTLVDNKFIYSRGLGERYSSTLLNGAQVPSPDPTRRVVPLDLFPTEILDGIVVQKTYAADQPGDFGGGTVQLRTRGVPREFLFRASGTLAYTQGTTGETGLGYRGGHRDWLGYDDGARAAPLGLLAPPPLPTGAALEGLGEALAAQGYAVTPQRIDPNSGFALSVGDDLPFADGESRFGYLAGVRYAQNWEQREEQRAFYALAGDRLVEQQNAEREITERAVDTSVFASAGLILGDRHRFTATALQVRQTTDEVQTDTGILGSGEFERLRSLEWIENQLRVGQVQGEHRFPQWHDLLVDWQYTRSQANRDAPNTREQRFAYHADTDRFRVDVFGFEQRFETLTDDADEYRLNLRLPFTFDALGSLDLSAGLGQLDKSRQSQIRRFRFSTSGPQFDSANPEDFFNPGTIGPGLRDYRLLDRTLPTDAYTAEVDLSSAYLAADAQWGAWRLYAGLRQEDILQEVVTVTPFDPQATPQVGRLDRRDRLPAAVITWAYSDSAQLRVAYGRSVSRPDIREQSPASFIDPLLDLRVVGNPDLRQGRIDSLDLRWEHYFGGSESVSIALFHKDFTDPIELIESPASGTLLNIINAASATNRGVELDYFRGLEGVAESRWTPGWLKGLPWEELRLGLNYAWIDSEIDLADRGGISTHSVRPLQGQSPYVANVSLGYRRADGELEATLLYNVFGERISQVGASGRPDTYEQPFHQLDFTLAATLPWEGWKLKMRLRNLLDPAARYTVGHETARRYRKGREAAFSLEWRF